MTTEPLAVGWKNDFHVRLNNGTIITPGAKVRRRAWDTDVFYESGASFKLRDDAHVIVTHFTDRGACRVRGIPVNLPAKYNEQTEWWLAADDWVQYEEPEPEPEPAKPFPFVKGDKIRWASWPDDAVVEITAVGTSKFLAVGNDHAEATFTIVKGDPWERYVEPPKRRRWIVETEEEEITYSSSHYSYVIAEDDGSPAIWRSDFVRNGPQDVIVSVREAKNVEPADD